MDRVRWTAIGKIALAVWMAVVIILAFLMPAQNLGSLGQAARVIFFHIPSAWVTVVAFMISSVFSILYLVKRRRVDDHRAVNASVLGVVFCILATVTGAIFATITWGSPWNWDPRETTIFFLLLFYAAYFVLRSAVADEERRAVFSGAYNVLGLVVVPFLVFIAPRLSVLAGLHPEPLINVRGELDMDWRALVIFLSSLAGFTGIFGWSYSLANRVSRLQDEILEQD